MKDGQSMRRGFTLIELLISITIIAVLVALLLPAVQQAREAARRTQCKNNLKQLVLALQNYEGAREMLPPGTVNPKGPIINKLPQPGTYHMSWTVQILPFIEQGPMQDMFNFEKSAYTPPNSMAQRDIPIFHCPTDPPPPTAPKRGYSNYAGVHSGNNLPIDVDQDGLLYLNSSVAYNDIPDGSSNTAIVGEKTAADTLWGWASGTRDTLRNGGSMINGPVLTAADMAMWDEVYGDGTSETTGESPGEEGEDVEEAELPADQFVGGFNSMHTGGAQFAMADGSVRFISENIHAPTFQNICSRNDGEMTAGGY